MKNIGEKIVVVLVSMLGVLLFWGIVLVFSSCNKSKEGIKNDWCVPVGIVR